MKQNLLTRTQLAERLFQEIKTEIESRGFSLWDENFDPNYPISLRSIWNIRKGIFKIETLNSLPGISVSEFFTLNETRNP
jgi:hypothetical protein